VQAVGWVDHLNALSLTTALGLIGGVIAAKQHRLPRLAVHAIAVVLGLLIAYWQTAGAFYAGNISAFTNGVHRWIQTALVGGTSNDDSIFLFFILALGFLLAYASAWLVYRTRRPWLMIVANAVVLLINLSNVSDGYIVFLIVFLIAALLLLLRFNLYESAQRWRRAGLRCADDLGWDFMQAGALISIGILILSWLLPWGYTNDAAGQIYVDETELTYNEFRSSFAALASQRAKDGVYLRADQGVPYGTVVRVLAVMRSTGVPDVGLVAEPEDIK